MATVQGAYSLVLAASHNTRPETIPDHLPYSGTRGGCGGDSENRRHDVDRATPWSCAALNQLRPAAATATGGDGRQIAGQQHDQRPRGADSSEHR